MALTKWILDTTHAEIQFKVKHLMISTVPGQFNTFEGSFESEGNDFLTAKALIKVDVNSISTIGSSGSGNRYGAGGRK